MVSHVVWNHCRERAYWVQPEFFAKSWTPKVTGGDMMLKKEASYPEAVFNEDNNNKGCPLSGLAQCQTTT